MILDLDALVIAVAFLLPGFLTSRLVEARTPAVGREATPLGETLGSLLRSAIIHLIISVVVLIGLWCVSPDYDQALLQRLGAEGLSAYYSARPLEALTISVLWLAAAFGMAFAFGSRWDPITYAMEHLATTRGLASEDLLYYLRRRVADAREETGRPYQLWVQVRLKNGYTYRGELVMAGYRDKGQSREFLLANVRFFPFPAQVNDLDASPPRLYDYAVIDATNCDSLEVLISDALPAE